MIEFFFHFSNISKNKKKTKKKLGICCACWAYPLRLLNSPILFIELLKKYFKGEWCGSLVKHFK